ncbi:unnamed protein product, partial [marine sediment metagenome]
MEMFVGIPSEHYLCLYCALNNYDKITDRIR